MASTWFLYCAQSCVFPHLTRYYDLDLHLTDWQIGLMMSMTSLAAALMQPVWGYLADRKMGRTQTFRLLLTLNFFFLIVFTFSYRMGGFALLLSIGMLFFMSYNGSLPLNAAIILSFLGRQRRHLFGRIRVMGSISFMVGMFVICPIMVGWSLQLGLAGRTLPFLTASGFYLIAIFFTFWNEQHFERHSQPEFQAFLILIRNRNLLVFYLSIFCLAIGASAGIQYIGPYVGHRGLSERFFSTMWMVGVSMEILLTFNLNHLVRQVGLKPIVICGFAAEFIRWGGMSWLQAPGWILVCNALHGPAVLGVFFASAMYLDNECEESIRSTAQALHYFSFVSGQVTGYILASLLVDHYHFLPRAEAIQSSFFWFSLFALGAAFLGVIFLHPETKPDSNRETSYR